MIELQNRGILITGGTRGIGAAVAVLAARAGAQVALGYRSSHGSAERLVEQIRNAGGQAIAIATDISTCEGADQLVEQARSGIGFLDTAIINAGIWKGAPIDEMTVSQWDEMMHTNLRSAYRIAHRVVPEMKEEGRGNLLFVSSTAGQRGEADHSHYAASKGALLALTKSLASELGPAGIRVNSVAPGWVDTEMCAGVFADRAFRDRIERGIPVGRIPPPEDIAGPILFLISDLARHVHGEILNVNGGSVLCG